MRTYTKDDLEKILESWKKLPDLFVDILKSIFVYLVYIAFFIGAILIIWGIIEWATGWNELNGKRNIVRGVILVILSIAPTLAIT